MKKTGIIAFTEHGCVLGEKLLRDLQKQDQEIYGFVKSIFADAYKTGTCGGIGKKEPSEVANAEYTNSFYGQ